MVCRDPSRPRCGSRALPLQLKFQLAQYAAQFSVRRAFFRIAAKIVLSPWQAWPVPLPPIDRL